MSGLTYSLGFVVRETGRALDRLGCQLQGSKAYLEECAPLVLCYACTAPLQQTTRYAVIELSSRRESGRLQSPVPEQFRFLKWTGAQTNLLLHGPSIARAPHSLCAELMLFTAAVWRHKPLQNLSTRKPQVGNGVFVAPSATLVGDVAVGSNANIWYGAILRGMSAQSATHPTRYYMHSLTSPFSGNL